MDKLTLDQIARAHDETAELAEYFGALALNEGDTTKHARCLAQAADNREWAKIYRAADTSL